MNNKKRFITNIIEIAVGVVLSGCGFAGILDEFWRGMGTALVIVGALKLVRQIRYQTSSSYKEAVDVQINDERNKYLRMKAWSWAGYLFVLIAAFATVILKILGYDQYSLLASGGACLMVVLYWVSYLILGKKY